MDVMGNPVAVKLGSRELTELPVTITNSAAQNIAVTNSAITFYLQGGQTAQIDSLPAGIYYKVEEIGVGGYWTSTATGDAGRIVRQQTSEAAFTNTYSAHGQAAFQVEKQVDGSVPQAGAFSFELYEEANWDATANQPRAGAQPAQTKTNAAVDERQEIYVSSQTQAQPNPDYGKSLVKFNTVLYTEEGTYNYFIREVQGSDPAIRYDGRVIQVTVVSKDNDGTGTLDTTVTYTDLSAGTPGNVIVNTLAGGSLKIIKNVDVMSAVLDSANLTFTVRVTLNDQNQQPLRQKTYQTLLTNGQTTAAGQSFTTNDSGIGQVALHPGETVEILDLPDGAVYELEEINLPDGFAQTDSENTQGTIESAKVSSASFTNTYKATAQLPFSVVKRYYAGTTPTGTWSSRRSNTLPRTSARRCTSFAKPRRKRTAMDTPMTATPKPSL